MSVQVDQRLSLAPFHSQMRFAGIGIAGELRAWSSIAELIPHIPTSVIESPPLKYPRETFFIPECF